jgi:hypothetical protein
MVKGTVIGPTAHKGRVTKPEALKVLTNETLVYVEIEVVLKTPKNEERGKLPTFPNTMSLLTFVLEETPNTLVARTDFKSL